VGGVGVVGFGGADGLHGGFGQVAGGVFGAGLGQVEEGALKVGGGAADGGVFAFEDVEAGEGVLDGIEVGCAAFDHGDWSAGGGSAEANGGGFGGEEDPERAEGNEDGDVGVFAGAAVFASVGLFQQVVLEAGGQPRSETNPAQRHDCADGDTGIDHGGEVGTVKGAQFMRSWPPMGGPAGHSAVKSVGLSGRSKVPRRTWLMVGLSAVSARVANQSMPAG
jgi:hypothetical protein